MRIHVEERRETGVHRADPIETDEHALEAVDERRRGSHIRSRCEDLEDRRSPVDGTDRVEDLESRDGGIMFLEDVEEESIQPRLQEWSITRGDEQKVSGGCAEPAVEALDGAATRSYISREHGAGKDGPDSFFQGPIRHGDDRLVGEGSDRGGDTGNQRATRQVDKSLRLTKPL